MGRALAVCGATGALTATANLDAAITVATPLTVETTASGPRDRPTVVGVARMANSASILLPVSNLTSLLVLDQLDLDVGGFVQRTWLAWTGAVAVELLAVAAWTAWASRRHRRSRVRRAGPVPP